MGKDCGVTMKKQYIIDHNKVNLDNLNAVVNYDKETFEHDWHLTETEPGYYMAPRPDHWDYDYIYNRSTDNYDRVHKPGRYNAKYVCIMYMEDDSMYEFGFTYRNRLRNIIKQKQSIWCNIVGRIIAEVKQ